MGFIYKITNQVNGKCYIGKTLQSIDQRWKQHLKDAQKYSNDRPLYKAITKYGKDNFKIEQIEECAETIINEREKYWISYYSSYHNGYNATLGGDGVHYLDYNSICKCYNQCGSLKETASILGIDVDTVRKALKNYNIPIHTANEVRKNRGDYSVKMYDKNDNFINCFDTKIEAAKWIKEHDKTITAKIETISCNIGRCVNGSRKTACGYKWTK